MGPIEPAPYDPRYPSQFKIGQPKSNTFLYVPPPTAIIPVPILIQKKPKPKASSSLIKPKKKEERKLSGSVTRIVAPLLRKKESSILIPVQKSNDSIRKLFEKIDY